MPITSAKQRQVGRSSSIQVYKEFDGGYTSHSIKHAIAKNKVVDVLNLYLDRLTSVWRKRKGYSRDNASAISTAGITGLWRHYGTTKYILAANGTNIYADNGAGVYSSIASGMANGVDVYFAAMEISGTLNSFSCNGNNQAIQKWNGTGSMAALGGSPPKGVAMKVHKNFLWIWDAANPQKIVYSDVANAESYPVNNFFNVKTTGAGSGVGFAIHDDALICFKDDSVWRIVGSSNDDFRLERVSVSTGCASQRSIVEAQDSLTYLGKDRQIYRLQADSAQPISLDIEPTIQDIDSNALSFVAGGLYQNYLYYSYRRASVAQNDRVLLYDILLKRWCGLYDLPVNCFVLFDGSGDTGSLYGGQSTNGFVLKLDTGTKDNTTTIQTMVQYRYEDQDEPSRLKRYSGCLIGCQPFNGTLKVELILDYNSTSEILASQASVSDVAKWGSAVWGTDIWGGQQFQQYKYRIPTPNKGYTASVKLSNTDSDDVLYFYSYALLYQPQNIRWSN